MMIKFHVAVDFGSRGETMQLLRACITLCCFTIVAISHGELATAWVSLPTAAIARPLVVAIHPTATATQFQTTTHPSSWLLRSRRKFATQLMSSFFGKFDEEFKEDDEDDDDDDEGDEGVSTVDDVSMADFRTRMDSLFDETDGFVDELISFAVKSDTPPAWAKPATSLAAGNVLVANPDAFCSDCAASANQSIRPALLAKFGLTIPPPIDLGPDRRADLLPVLIVVEHNQKRSRAVLLNRRTGYLLGDLEQQQQQQQEFSGGSSSSSSSPILEKFCIQPLWFGGVDSDDNSGSGLDMLHQCPAVDGAIQITTDGLYWGGDPAQAQEAMSATSTAATTTTTTTTATTNDRIYTGFDFKFFVQSTIYPGDALQRELERGTFFAVSVAKDVLFKSRDRMGTRRAKPLWTEIIELLGAVYWPVKHRLYQEGVDDMDDDTD